MISVYCWKESSKTCRWGGVAALNASCGDDEVRWVDLEAPTAEEERRVFEEFFPVHPLTLEDITRLRRLPEQPPHFPKVEEFPDYLFVVANPLNTKARDRLIAQGEDGGGQEEGRLITQLSAILGQRVLITHHCESLVSTGELRSYLERHQAQAARGPDSVDSGELDL
jgi:magnesium transporter